MRVVLVDRLKAILNANTHTEEIFKGSAITFFLKMSGMLLSYIAILIISRQYGAEGVGLYSLTFGLMTFVAMISVMGINVSILRYVGEFKKNGKDYKLKLLYRYALELVVPFSLLLSSLLYAFSGFIAESVFHNASYKAALEFSAFVVPFIALQNIGVEFIRGLKLMKVSEFLRSVNHLFISVTLLSIVGLYLTNQLLPIYTLGIGVFVSAVFSVYFILKKIQTIKAINHNDFSKKELVETSMPMMVTVVASFVLGSIPLFMLEVFSTTKDVGVFSVAFKIATMVSLVLVVVNTISAPKFSELYWNKEYKTLQLVIDSSTRLIFIVSLIVSILIILFTDQILMLFGNDFISGSHVLILLVVAQMINSATGSVSILLNMIGSQKALKNIAIIVTTLTIVVSYILVSNYGSIGAAYTFIISMALLNISGAIYAHMKLGYITYYNPLNFKASKQLEGEGFE